MKTFAAFLLVGVVAGQAWGGKLSLDEQIRRQEFVATQRLLANVSPTDARPGTVIASPSRENPDYYYHWVRDAALVMQVVLNLYEDTKDPVVADYYLHRVYDFVELTRYQQNQDTLSGLGEPKFYVDGRGFDGPWGRPQNDGPALRASVMIRWAEILLDRGDWDTVREELYDSGLLRNDRYHIIKTDLEFVSHHWQEANFDLWEEVKGDHFYTRYVQRKALIDGARLARRMGDTRAATWYERQAERITKSLDKFLSRDQGVILTTLNQVEGLGYKSSNQDTANILAILHASNHDNTLPASSDWVLNTAHQLHLKFNGIYAINYRLPELGTAYGRYPEDQYYSGNPWFLTTLAIAELYFQVAAENRVHRQIEITSRNQSFYSMLLTGKKASDLIRVGSRLTHESSTFEKLQNQLEQKANQLFHRVLFHMGHDGSMAEQMNKNHGFMESARDLTWSYAAFLTAAKARKNYLEANSDF